MPTNQEWLHKLANESPDELKAWFDAEHVYDMDNAECVHMCPNEANDENQRESGVSGDAAHSNDANAHLKAHSKTEPMLSEQSALLSEELDSREKLEADVRSSLGFTTKDVFEWLDRQAAITNAAWKQLKESWITAHDSLLIENGELREEVDRLQRRNDELRTSYDKLKCERDNLADDLLACNREREQLRKHLGIALDHAHDICSLVDIDGNVLDVGD